MVIIDACESSRLIEPAHHRQAARIACGASPDLGLASWLVTERLASDVVAKVAYLARLDLTSAEIERATEQLGNMLEHFADIDALDLADVEPMTQPYPLVNVMRDDVIEPGLDRDEVLAAAPQTEDGRFRVPPAGGEG
jgi:aspartyl-tRNA(Asn)/glutamyl-tRNA(Gln) amidotransferase subunit C